jgi:hypothetical protein
MIQHLPSIEKLQSIQADLQQLAKPFVKIKCDILAVNVPTYRIHCDGYTEAIYSPEVLEELRKVDAFWKETADAYLKAI